MKKIIFTIGLMMVAVMGLTAQQKDFPNALCWGEKALAEDPDNYRHQELVAEVKKQMK